MYSRILVAVDGSESSWQALKCGTELAKRLSASLRVIHVVESAQAPVGPDQAGQVQAASAAAGQTADDIMSTVRETVAAAGYEAETAALNAAPSQRVEAVILDEISRWPAKLLVMGIHGQHGFKSLQPGSVAEEMTRLSPIPLLLIPTRTD
ncbi:MAG: universal stress protein [Pseudomonadota bacterium]